jgi:hypothetical protein
MGGWWVRRADLDRIFDRSQTARAQGVAPKPLELLLIRRSQVEFRWRYCIRTRSPLRIPIRIPIHGASLISKKKLPSDDFCSMKYVTTAHSISAASSDYNGRQNHCAKE